MIHFTVSGHAGTAERGHDLVCAAVTALCYGVAMEIAQIDKRRFKTRKISMENSDVGAEVLVECIDRKTYRRVLYNLSPMERTLRMMAHENPEAITVEHTNE